MASNPPSRWRETDYNKAKHDRTTHMDKATLQRCVEAVTANIVMFCVRFSPFPLIEQNTPVASLVNHLFGIDLVGVDPASFYVPLDAPTSGTGTRLSWGDVSMFMQPWTTKPLVL